MKKGTLHLQNKRNLFLNNWIAVDCHTVNVYWFYPVFWEMIKTKDPTLCKKGKKKKKTSPFLDIKFTDSSLASSIKKVIIKPTSDTGEKIEEKYEEDKTQIDILEN